MQRAIAPISCKLKKIAILSSFSRTPLLVVFGDLRVIPWVCVHWSPGAAPAAPLLLWVWRPSWGHAAHRVLSLKGSQLFVILGVQREFTPSLQGCASSQEGRNNFHQTSLYFMSKPGQVVWRKIHLMNAALRSEGSGGEVTGSCPERGRIPDVGPRPEPRPAFGQRGPDRPPRILLLQDDSKHLCGKHSARISAAAARGASGCSPRPLSPKLPVPDSRRHSAVSTPSKRGSG